jgi:phosphoribosylformimino-5-aminoimidazole carboxamide ribotide isomerase
VRGERDEYAPLQSRLVSGSDPVEVARALIAATGARELYVADLDAIAGREASLATVTALAALAEVAVDAGATTVPAIDAIAATGARRIVMGTESLAAGELERLCALRPAVRVALSIDLRGGRLVSADPRMHGRTIDAARALAAHPGLDGLIVIDLARVGTGEGPALDTVRAVASWRPTGDVFAGGGVRDNADLDRLGDCGATGALVATALHTGAIIASR